MQTTIKTEMFKYPSIENTYQQKNIDNWLRYHPGLADESFIVTEKIHGSNFQVLFTPNAERRYFSRNQEILPGEKFHGYQAALSEESLKNTFSIIQDEADMNNIEIRLFGELFGAGIMKGVDYGLGSEKRFRVFDMVIGNEWVTQKKLFYFTPALTDVLVPDYGVMGLQEALNFNVDQPTSLNPVDGNIQEGIVIKPYSKVYRSPEGSMFYLKKKAEAFMEKSREKAPVAVDSEVQEVNLIFMGYINDNRVQSAFSKMGEIQEPKQMAGYIKAIWEDARVDFLKEHESKFQKLSKDQQKKALNVGSLIANLLKPYL